MGLKYENYNTIIVKAMNYFGDDFNKIKMLELGCQQIRRKTYPYGSPVRSFSTTKEYFTSLGIEHVSIDMNGKFGSLKIDLSHTVDKPEWKNYFDCVTNLGTIEHIDQNGMEGQHNAFKFVHDCNKLNGLMIHLAPLHGFIKGHCFYRYTEQFVEKLACNNNYEILHNDIWTVNENVRLLRFIYKKNSQQDFMSLNSFIEMNEIRTAK